MAENTKIEWCDHTFNPWIGCTKVGPGCDHCYAEQRMETRLHRVQWGAGQPRKRTKTWGDPVRWNANAFNFFEDNGRRQRVFCASLADVFDNEVPAEWRRDLFDLIRATPRLDWLLLTKRIGNAVRMLPWTSDGAPGNMVAGGMIWPNVWIGATIVNQEEADRDIPKLLATPAAAHFLSMEPLLGPVNLEHLPAINYSRMFQSGETLKALSGGVWNGSGYRVWHHPFRLDWVIVGGESGPNARPMHPDWARSLRDQCKAEFVPFHFKQWGEFASVSAVEGPGAHHHFPDGATVRRVGKKAAGRLLDGVTHDGYPEVTP